MIRILLVAALALAASSMAITAMAQTNGVEMASGETNAFFIADRQRLVALSEQLRAQCIAGRRVICGKF